MEYLAKLKDAKFIVPVAIIAILAVMLYNNFLRDKLPGNLPTA